MKKLTLLGVLLILLSACGASGQSVASGTTTDYVTAVEQRVNGVYMVFALNDPTTSYCTTDANVAANANKYREGRMLVDIAYSGINSGDKDGETVTGGGCENRAGIQVLRLNSITLNGTSTAPAQ